MFEIDIQETPNPTARKFIFGFSVIEEGRKASFLSTEDCENIPLAGSLMDIKGVVQLHFFDNFITVSKSDASNWDDLEEEILEVMQTMIENHDPKFEVMDEDAKRKASYENMPKELRRVNEVLDKTVRSYLQMDGGDLQVLQMDEDKKIYIRYEGACGGCPTAFSGTLNAIENILKSEIHPDVTVIPV